MKSTSYLQRLGTRWYVRVKVPRSLQGRLRNTHVRRALGTSDLCEANRRKWDVVAQIQGELERIRQHHERLHDAQQPPIHGEPRQEQRWAPSVLPRRLSRTFIETMETLDSLVDRWLADADYREQTKKQHRQAYGELRTFMGGDRPVSAVTPQVALDFVEEHLKRSGRAYLTQRRKLNSLMALWEWLALRRLTPRGSNPWRGFKLATKKTAQTPSKRKRPYTAEELVRLFSQQPAYDGLSDVMILGLLTGMRLNEICALRMGDIHPDGDNGFLVSIREAKTRAGVRDLVLAHPLGSRVISGRWRADAPLDHPLFPEFKGGGYDGKPSWAVSKAFARHRDRCGLTRETDFHSLRRTFITLLENLSVDQVRIARYVGHELPTLAFAVYSGGSSTQTMRAVANAALYPEHVEARVAAFLEEAQR